MLEDVINFPQLLGILAFILGVLCFYQRNDKTFRIVMLIQNITYMSHFWLLGANVAAMGALFSTIRTATSIYISSKYIALFFVVLGILWGYFITDFLWQIFPIIGSVIGTISLFLLQGIPMRLFMLAGSFCWLINNILVNSLGGILLESTVIVMNTFTIIRLIRQKR
ncbi:inner membrane protein [Pasteurella langaaensis DSM 22999]|uniref:Inner membrane protein n=1 Tax=Alitibacter langaaensis DSM 22999 TaxID=1122935 RepID=A0A2U0TD43_9PAST|nr:YgjV family protein [Pasteurella langaaensis]PVX41545.1 inner membrane protein [Pasteurella langaaensis DSM 22999]